MKKDFTKIIIVLDKSGSMQKTALETVQALNNFLDEQKKLLGEVSLTFYEFNEHTKKVFSGKLDDCPNLYYLNKDSSLQTYQAVPLPFFKVSHEYKPVGMTAYLDAFGKVITKVGKELSDLFEDERPNKIIFIVLTDGEDNASHYYKKDKITEMIKHQTDIYNWQFIFLGANFDAVKEGQSLGLNFTRSVNYNQNNIGATIKLVSSKVATYRDTGISSYLDY
jgi:uncharacterized protein YegL